MKKIYANHIERSKAYICVRFNGKITTLHRAIWELVNGKIPKDAMIHHKDGNKSNNNIENLEMVTREKHGELHRNNGDN